MSLKHTYTIFAPIYDRFVGGVFDTLRQSNLNELQRLPLSTSKILLSGIGTGLDLPLLPQGPEYVGMDLTPAMLDKARGRAKNLNIELRTGDVMCLPFEDNHFDAIVMHLILAVVPKPALAQVHYDSIKMVVLKTRPGSTGSSTGIETRRLYPGAGQISSPWPDRPHATISESLD